jgi:uncharacterized membrane protein
MEYVAVAFMELVALLVMQPKMEELYALVVELGNELPENEIKVAAVNATFFAVIAIASLPIAIMVHMALNA